MIDLHSHILPGLDDGIRTLPEAVELARAAVADGVTAIAATPHVRDDYPTSPKQMEEGVTGLRRALEASSVPLEVLHGGELSLEWAARLGEDELRRFSIGQGGRYLLLEPPYHGWPAAAFAGAVDSLGALGLVAIIAHPERNPEIQSRLDRLLPLIEAGALVQVTAASLEGRLGRSSQRAARDLLDRGLCDLIATDSHSPDLRAGGLAAAAAIAGDGLGEYLTRTVPEAILHGGELPPRPPDRRRRRFPFR